MTADALFSTAFNAADVRAESSELISQDETICVIQTGSGRLYSGVSHFEPSGMFVHAEAAAVSNMQLSGENLIVGLLLIGTLSRVPLLPCNACIGIVLSLNPENRGCTIFLPDRMINIGEAAMYASYSMQMRRTPSGYGYGGRQTLVSGSSLQNAEQQEMVSPAKEGSFSGDILKNKVKSLLDAAEDDEDEEEQESPSGKKGFFSGLFRR